MDKLEIIQEIKNKLPEELLNGTYSKNGKVMPLYEFLDNIFIRFIKDGASVDNLITYVRDKIIPDVIPKVKYDQRYIDYVDAFLASREDLVATVRISETELVSTRDYLISKIPFMDENFLVTVGPNKKTLYEVYMMLLNNEYHPATLKDKEELCIDLSSFLTDEVMDSIMDGMSITVRSYITEVLPTIMVNATDIVIGGKNVGVDEVVARINERQMEIIEEQRQREIEERLEMFNRTSENPSLLGEIQVAMVDDDNLEITTSIPLVSSSQLSDEEVQALSHLAGDELYSNPESYYRVSLNNLKESIEHTNNAHDLEAKAGEFNALVSSMDPNIAGNFGLLIESIAELVVQKRNVIIKVDNNKDEYSESLIDRLTALSKMIRTLDNVDDFTSLMESLHFLENEIIEKGITDASVWQVLKDAKMKLDRYRTRFNLNREEYDRDKSSVMSSINDKISTIRRNIFLLSQVTDEREAQRLNIDIDVKKDAITSELAEALKDKVISEETAKMVSAQVSALLEKNTKVELGL